MRPFIAELIRCAESGEVGPSFEEASRSIDPGLLRSAAGVLCSWLAGRAASG
jgi:hypothetical protein